MKHFLVICSLFSMAAFAETKTPVSLTKVSFDGETLTGNYVTGGGCQEHKSEVEVNVTKTSEYTGVVDIKIYDVTAEPDYCEALLYPEVSANLKEMITAKAEELGLSTWGLTVNIPVALR